MDTETYDQYTIPIQDFEEKGLLMKEGETYKVAFWEDTPIDIKLPYKVVYTVVEAGEGIKTDTVKEAMDYLNS